ncbi:MAG: ABC transporter ATP-binding protein/permease [Defluviitaleaceae bacterium]|nr:ABC transporter ATP-binding protein/permease [Defluviitaleaceae bacterium]
MITQKTISMKGLLISYFKKNWVRYIFGLAMVFVSTYFAASIPRLVGEAIDTLDQGFAGSYIATAAFAIGFAAIMAFAIRFIWRFLVLGFTRGAETYVRLKLFEHLETLSADFYIKHNTGDIITRAIQDVTAIRRMFGFGFVAALDAVAIFTIAAINMQAAAGWGMMFFAMFPAPFLIFFVSRIRKQLRRRQYAIREASSNLASKIQENLSGIRVIKTYAQEDLESDNVAKLSTVRWKAEMRQVKLSATISPIIQIAFGLVFAVFIIYGSRMVIDPYNVMTLGDFIAFNGYIALIIGPVSMVGRVIELWQTGMSSIQRLDEMLKTTPTVNDSQAKEGTEVKGGKITVRNLKFAYPTTEEMPGKRAGNVLNDISFTINPGETLAVTGPVGSGKSTFANILLRLWPIPTGMVTIDGEDINHIPIKNLRGAIGYVPQDNFLFSDSIMNNIRFYSDSVSDEDIFTAAKAVSIHDNIETFPDKYETVVGERGMTLSGGQKQRVSIARALVRQPKILLLDDCLSAVDAETEHAIIEGLQQYISGITGIIITHRAAAAQLADRILVLSEHGEIAELGTYDELMKRRGAFYDLVMLQTSGTDTDTGGNIGVTSGSLAAKKVSGANGEGRLDGKGGGK